MRPALLALIPLPPLISFAILIFFGRRLGKHAPLVSLAALLGSLAVSVMQLEFILDLPRLNFVAGGELYDHLTWAWLPFGEHPVRMGFFADPLSITMCLVVTVVGWLIMLYSIGYMGKDPRFSRFFAYLSLFCGAMLTLVLADNFLLLYIGWEGVGLCSYLLISFWFEREAAANAGKKAFLTTRVGDLGLLAAILIILKLTGDLSFSNLAGRAAALGHWAPWVALLIFWGASGKSAQFPLHVWLPDAMEGPTPVSALIHAATMVAAGVYLVARTLPLFLQSPDVLLVVAGVGGVTSLGAATIACTQTDLKKILAYSTISQLGLMMMGLGCGSAAAGMFHLVTHAWFKALLFLGAGSVIHAMHHQEITRMGGLWKPMPVTAITFLAGALTMSGIPPFSGFWSKEALLGAVAQFSAPHLPHAGMIFLGMALSISFLTAFYITRAVILTFFGTPREAAHDSEITSGAASSSRSHPHESPLVMTGPLMILALGAAAIGAIGAPWGGYRFQLFLGTGAAVSPHGPEWIQLISVLVAAGGIGLAILRYGLGLSLAPQALRRALRPAYRLVQRKYYIDEIEDVLLIRPILALSKKAFSFDARIIDGAVNASGVAGLAVSRAKGWIDRVLVDGAVNQTALAVGRAGGTLRLLQTGLVQNYLLIAAAAAGVIFLLLGGVR